MSPRRKETERARALFVRIEAAVEDGRVSVDELNALANRPTKVEIPALINTCLKSLRSGAMEIPDMDMKIRAGILTVVACISHNDDDLDVAFHEIFQMENGTRSQAIAVIISTLAEAGKLDVARNLAPRIGEDGYWLSQAWIAIGAYSREQKDFLKARAAVKKIADRELKNEVLAEIEHTERHEKEKRSRSGYQTMLRACESLQQLVRSLEQANGFTKTHAIHEEMENAKQRALTRATVLDILAELIH